MAKLSAQTIAELYASNLAGLQAKITEYETLLSRAAAGGYSIDTTQGRQSASLVDDPTKVGELLEAYMKAYLILTGKTFVRMAQVNFTP